MSTSFIDNHEAIRKSSALLSLASNEERIKALFSVKESLLANIDKIKNENLKDIEKAKENGIKSSVLHRLELTDSKIRALSEGLDDLSNLPDPIGIVREKRELDKNFILTKKTFPIGIIGMIFEARPDALVQIASLALRSGNGIFMKGGKEALNTNRILVKVIKEATENTSFKSGWIENLETHEDVNDLLGAKGLVDLIIPRGSNSFVSYVMNNTMIPVIGHSDGICSIYVDSKADFSDKSVNVIVDSKIQYPAACNAVETLLFNRNVSPDFIKRVFKELGKNGVKIHAGKELLGFSDNLIEATEEDFDTEYLDLELACRYVDSIESAIDHINTHGSHHTDAIISDNKENIELFFNRVDSADVFSNCSTRFADGFRFGLGAEVGISTSKIHARGPVGLDGLVTTKWILEGNGEIVDDYSKGIKSFHHKEL